MPLGPPVDFSSEGRASHFWEFDSVRLNVLEATRGSQKKHLSALRLCLWSRFLHVLDQPNQCFLHSNSHRLLTFSSGSISQSVFIWRKFGTFRRRWRRRKKPHNLKLRWQVLLFWNSGVDCKLKTPGLFSSHHSALAQPLNTELTTFRWRLSVLVYLSPHSLGYVFLLPHPPVPWRHLNLQLQALLPRNTYSKKAKIGIFGYIQLYVLLSFPKLFIVSMTSCHKFNYFVRTG